MFKDKNLPAMNHVLFEAESREAKRKAEEEAANSSHKYCGYVYYG